MKANFNFEEKSKINPFEVPNGYFEEFALKIEQQIQPKIMPMRVSFMERTKPFLYAAAMILAIFTIGTVFMNNFLKSNISENQPVAAYDEASDQMFLEELSEDAMIDYILANAR